MRNIGLVRPIGAMAALLFFSSIIGQGAQRTGTAAGQAGAAFNPRDLSGEWDRTSQIVTFSNVPGEVRGDPGVEAPFTPEGKKRFDENHPGYGPRATNTKRNDPLVKCEPLGLVRNINSEITGPHSTFEMVQIPGKVLQFFEYHHDWREIWMDGRQLPTLNDVDPKWNGYSVGRWEGDTLVVESTGFDERSWIDKFGYPHSEEMRTEERYRRVDSETLEIIMTITDPVIYSKPWKSDRKLFKLNRPKAGRWEEQIYCVPSDEFTLNEVIQYDGRK